MFEESLSIKDNEISFNNVENLLIVKSIKLKQVSEFRWDNSFVVKITSIENIQLFICNNKISGKTGENEMYSTFEVSTF
jgi:hypothetical protein